MKLPQLTHWPFYLVGIFFALITKVFGDDLIEIVIGGFITTWFLIWVIQTVYDLWLANGGKAPQKKEREEKPKSKYQDSKHKSYNWNQHRTDEGQSSDRD